MATLGFGQRGRFSPHAFRRRATDALKNGDSAHATILKSGTCVSESYRHYLESQSDGALNISALLIGDLSSGSEDASPNQKSGKQKLEMR